jgi:wyosine [tRNA(Phe)-imidazoG37] synthetase (radical SAM superfamily)
MEMKTNKREIDTITFAGNGEPTLHPDFPEIIDDTIFLRNKYYKQAKIAVLSNASNIHQTRIFNALLKVDQNILKLDSAFDKTIQLHNNPGVKIVVKELVDNLRKFRGKLIIQTMFVQGIYRSRVIDNTTEEEVDAWLKLIKKIHPREVMIYTIERDTPSEGLKKVPEKILYSIGDRVSALGYKVQIST